MNKLISSVDYGIYLDALEITDHEYRVRRKKYDLFLRQKIKKTDFIAHDFEGNMIEGINLSKKQFDIKKALSTIVFEGFEYKRGLILYQGNVIDEECFGITRIQDLIPWNLKIKDNIFLRTQQ